MSDTEDTVIKVNSTKIIKEPGTYQGNTMKKLREWWTSMRLFLTAQKGLKSKMLILAVLSRLIGTELSAWAETQIADYSAATEKPTMDQFSTLFELTFLTRDEKAQA